MELSLMKITIFSILSFVLYAKVCEATPLGNRWYPTDSRCEGGYFSGIRLKRSVTSNNDHFEPVLYHYKFNPNYGKCEVIYGGSGDDYQTFATQSECERKCLDVYHF